MKVEMIEVKGGTFKMGSDKMRHERPIHEVTVNDFEIGKTQVTQDLYVEVMKENPSPFKGDRLPVEYVSWYNAIVFCNKLSAMKGLKECYFNNDSGEISCNFENDGYRLPTEAEWEYAAIGGNKSKGYLFSGSDSESSVGWHKNNSGGHIRPVGLKQPNELGIHDMSGNVQEWCWDIADFYPNGSESNSSEMLEYERRILRGGGWENDPFHIRSAFRNYYLPHLPTDSFPGEVSFSGPATRYPSGFGFRICRTLNANN